MFDCLFVYLFECKKISFEKQDRERERDERREEERESVYVKYFTVRICISPNSMMRDDGDARERKKPLNILAFLSIVRTRSIFYSQRGQKTSRVKPESRAKNSFGRAARVLHNAKEERKRERIKEKSSTHTIKIPLKERENEQVRERV